MIDRAATVAAYPSEWRAVSMFGSPGRRMAFWLVVVAYLVWAIGDLSINWDRVLRGFPRALDMFARMLPPAVGSKWAILGNGMAESVQMAIASSLAGMVLAIPLGLAAARNLAPRPMGVGAPIRD